MTDYTQSPVSAPALPKETETFFIFFLLVWAQTEIQTTAPQRSSTTPT